MAQLPPKIPTQWPGVGFGNPHKLPPPLPVMPFFLNATNDNNPSWVDEFLNFSSAHRGSHRRSASDSVAFLETSPPPEGAESSDFDRLNDDDQLMYMFSDVGAGQPPLPPTLSPSTPSDHNSIHEEAVAKATTAEQRAEEVQSQCKAETVPQGDMTEPDVIVDPKRVKRILANRQSAQRSRLRKLQYISELERSVTALQTEVSALSPRVAFLDHQRTVLTVGNSHLKQRIAALAQDKVFKDAHQEALKKEIERLRRVHQQQSLKRAADSPAAADAPLVPAENKDLLC